MEGVFFVFNHFSSNRKIRRLLSHTVKPVAHGVEGSQTLGQGEDTIHVPVEQHEDLLAVQQLLLAQWVLGLTTVNIMYITVYS